MRKELLSELRYKRKCTRGGSRGGLGCQGQTRVESGEGYAGQQERFPQVHSQHKRNWEKRGPTAKWDSGTDDKLHEKG